MAVVQISRIQVRRGKENSGTGVPQLASGELAWSVDTQNLYIGNGSVAEGSPAVGNTKILTELDLSVNGNVLNLIQYQYKANDPSIQTGDSANTPIIRSIQDRFDNYVSTQEFGTVADGITDDTAAIQRAVDQLFLNPNGTTANTNTPDGISKRMVLTLPPGKYFTTGTIYIPSYATLVGSGADKTVIYYNPTSTFVGNVANNSTTITSTAASQSMVGATVSGLGIPTGVTVVSVVDGISMVISAPATATHLAETITIILASPAIQFVNDLSAPGAPSSLGTTLGANQPRNIQVSNLTVYAPTGKNTCLQLDAVKNSVFENINLQGDWGSQINLLNRGIFMQAVSGYELGTEAGVTCYNNLFKNIKFTGFTYSVFAKQDIRNNTFEDCHIEDGYQGFSLGAGSDGSSNGQTYGPRETEIVNCKFYFIRRQAVYIERGYGNITRDCKYTNVGNDGGGNASAIYPQVYFNTFGNSSQNDYSDRHNDLATTNLATQYVPEIAGHGKFTLSGTQQQLIGYISTSSALCFRLPCSTSSSGVPVGVISYEINYIYKSNSLALTRRGTVTMSADIDNNKIQLSDEYDVTHSGSLTEVDELRLEFKGVFLDANSAVYTGAPGQSITSIGIYYTNSLNADTGTLAYSYTTTL